MKVLLLHPEDRLLDAHGQGWDLVVDLGRSPVRVYEEWSRQAGCRVVSLYQYSQGFDDMYRLKSAVHLGNGIVVDKHGIDWWDVLFPVLLSDLEQSFMLLGLAGELGDRAQLYCSRPDLRATALGQYLHVDCRSLHAGTGLGRKIRHYRHALAHLDFQQLIQIALDKFDSEHSIRRRFAARYSSTGPVFLLPTAYINVSRTAVSYASLLPEQRFLLAVARSSGRLASLPGNVEMVSLDAYFASIDRDELAVLKKKWQSLASHLDTPEFRMAGASGVLQRGTRLLHWGLAARDAWIRLFEDQDIAGCLSADDVNPYTSLPLFIAKQRNVPTLAVHHGALDGRMAAKPVIADHYLAKGELEYDYLIETCRVKPERIVIGSGSQPGIEPIKNGERPWLVFFTEPYGTAGWRMNDVYEELLPELWKLAKRTGLKLVFKMHPFESIKGHRDLTSRFLAKNQVAEISWIDVPMTAGMWNQIRFAMTVESTIALECSARQIPVFLCGWLQHVYGGYIQQYAKFGVGHILKSPDKIQDIPQLLADWKAPDQAGQKTWQPIHHGDLLRLLSGSGRRASLASAQVIAS